MRICAIINIIYNIYSGPFLRYSFTLPVQQVAEHFDISLQTFLYHQRIPFWKRHLQCLFLFYAAACPDLVQHLGVFISSTMTVIFLVQNEYELISSSMYKCVLLDATTYCKLCL